MYCSPEVRPPLIGPFLLQPLSQLGDRVFKVWVDQDESSKICTEKTGMIRLTLQYLLGQPLMLGPE